MVVSFQCGLSHHQLHMAKTLAFSIIMRVLLRTAALCSLDSNHMHRGCLHDIGDRKFLTAKTASVISSSRRSESALLMGWPAT